MRAEEWEQIKAIFEAALNVSEPNREAYLEAACGNNRELRRTVGELLASHLEATQFLEDEAFPIQHVFAEGDVVAGRFRIARFISSGGMGEVYEAYDQKLRLRLALKTLRPEYAANSEHLERFQREILVARGVAHESLCHVYDLIEHHPQDSDRVVPCLTMQLLDGETLLTYLKRKKPLDAGCSLRLIRQIAGAIEALHQNGVVHRDLKPSNIMVIAEQGEETRAVVMDFGLAKPLDGRPEFFESQVDFQAGAPYFMAPELLRGGKPSMASDIYSLGLLIDEMVTQSPAYQAESVQSLYYQKLWEKPIAPSARADQLPAGWEPVILRCLDTEPSRRYSRVPDIVRELEQTVESAPAARGSLPSKPSTGKRRQWLAAVRNWKLALVILLILVTGGMANSLLLRPMNTSVMVFPIVNITNRPDYDYLCTGTTTELMRRMSQMNGVKVIRFYEPRSKAAPSPANARFSLDGFLQAFETQIRMTVQLTDNQDGALVWSQNFDRELRNPLELQSEIAQGSLRALESRAILGVGGRVGSAGMLFAGPLRGLFGLQTGAARPPTTSAAAFDLYIRGRHLLDERTVPAALDAIRCFEGALREDRTFALAEAALADAQFVLMDYNQAPNLELLMKAHDYAERAVTLGGDLPETHLSLAATRQTLWDWTGAEESYQQALRLNPKLSRAHRWYGGFILQFGRVDEALAQERIAVELDPYDFPGQCAYGLYLYYSGRYQETIDLVKRTASQKDLLCAHVVLGDVNARLGTLTGGPVGAAHFQEALRQADIVTGMERRTLPEAADEDVFLRFADRMHALYYADLGDRQRSAPYLERMLQDMNRGRTSPSVVAWIYAALGDSNEALALLEKAAAQKDRQLLYLKILPYFDRLRSQVRFQNVLRQMNL